MSSPAKGGRDKDVFPRERERYEDACKNLQAVINLQKGEETQAGNFHKNAS
jgi:hypothetical protein